MRTDVSYEADQFERLQGSRPALLNVFTLKAMANRLRHRAHGYQFVKPDRKITDDRSRQSWAGPSTGISPPAPLPQQSVSWPPRDSVAHPDVQGLTQDLIQHTPVPEHSSRLLEPSMIKNGPDNLVGLYMIFVHPICALMVCIPLGILSPFLQWGDLCSFWLNFLALVPLAKILGDATEELAASLQNETVSGLLNASFGNAVEMIVSVQALRANLLSVVKLSLLGSVLSNILLVLGSAFLLGGLTPSPSRRGRTYSFRGTPGATIGMEKEQKFALKSALVSMALLLFSCMSFSLPTMFDMFSGEHRKVLLVSRIGAWIVLSTYVAFLSFQLVTHTKTLSRDEQMRRASIDCIDQVASQEDEVEQVGEEDTDEECASISAPCAVLLMIACTVVTAINSEILVDVLESVVETAGIPETFIGVILLPIAGNACEHAGAIRFAMHDRPGLAIGIAVGSSTQVALLVVPFAVIVGSFMGRPMDLNFGGLNAMVVTFSVLVVLTLLLDGRSNWMKGYLLVALYVFTATLYWFIPAAM
mmetsp:Transcript_64521/g.178903  ORF Transcript_64521/g.178903 Transcript_64521/m.178903 type:complete len:531 (+) Transcript_64521:63-1655(+)